MSSNPRAPGQLQAEILNVLSSGYALSVSAIHTAVLDTSAGAVLQALRKLEKKGKVTAEGASPTKWRITVPVTGSSGATYAARLTATPAPRPGGQLYHPRDLAGASDIDVLRRLRDEQIPVLLYGPPGTGKTSLVEAAFPEVITVAGDGDTTVGDLIGEYTQDPATAGFRFVYGPLVRAMESGVPLFIDDATLIAPGVLAVLYPAMDGRGEIAVKAHTGEIIKAQPGFYVVAGHNPGVAGAHLSEALASRFSVHIRVTTDAALARSLGVPPIVLRIAASLHQRQSDGDITWAPQLRELLGAKRVAEVLGLDIALANLVAIAPDLDADIVAQVVESVAGRTISPLALGRQLPPPPHSGTGVV